MSCNQCKLLSLVEVFPYRCACGKVYGAPVALLQQRPGRELQRLVAWFGQPSTECRCDQHAAQMDAWGVEGCRDNLDTIVGWLLDAAEQRGWPSGPLSRWAARRLVLVAIARAERER
jgi:hypothetical protein